MRRAATALCVAALTASPLAAAEYGLVVGVDDYIYQRPLKGAANDARDIALALQGRDMARVEVLLNQAASKAAVSAASRAGAATRMRSLAWEPGTSTATTRTPSWAGPSGGLAARAVRSSAPEVGALAQGTFPVGKVGAGGRTLQTFPMGKIWAPASCPVSP